VFSLTLKLQVVDILRHDLPYATLKRAFKELLLPPSADGLSREQRIMKMVSVESLCDRVMFSSLLYNDECAKLVEMLHQFGQRIGAEDGRMKQLLSLLKKRKLPAIRLLSKTYNHGYSSSTIVMNTLGRQLSWRSAGDALEELAMIKIEQSKPMYTNQRVDQPMEQSSSTFQNSMLAQAKRLKGPAMEYFRKAKEAVRKEEGIDPMSRYTDEAVKARAARRAKLQELYKVHRNAPLQPYAAKSVLTPSLNVNLTLDDEYALKSIMRREITPEMSNHELCTAKSVLREKVKTLMDVNECMGLTGRSKLRNFEIDKSLNQFFKGPSICADGKVAYSEYYRQCRDLTLRTINVIIIDNLSGERSTRNILTSPITDAERKSKKFTVVYRDPLLNPKRTLSIMIADMFAENARLRKLKSPDVFLKHKVYLDHQDDIHRIIRDITLDDMLGDNTTFDRKMLDYVKPGYLFKAYEVLIRYVRWLIYRERTLHARACDADKAECSGRCLEDGWCGFGNVIKPLTSAKQ
jgi:hypothetical protein